ncbi:transporter [Streptococcus himalayensis]|uniref:Transporter n=1 Tax=Streptococcus himalayensis TaxID=1888195 RepID=A0A917EFM3_9STRE|nr:transporter [Streptococcus himalayensis]GGE28898.1 transporter [Streptococcus himalayensis]
MKLALRNKFFAFISLSRFFNTTGASIYNLVFVVFAASMPNPSRAIALANIIVLIPTFFTIFVGIKADKTKEKAKWLIQIGYLQAGIFLAIALLTKTPTYLAFSIICLFNIFSDMLSDFRSGLQMPMIQKNIAEEDLMESYSFTQLLSVACGLIGQGIGVWLLAISHQNFTLVALVNALAFLLSSSILYFVRSQLTYETVDTAEEEVSFTERLKSIYSNAKLIFNQTDNGGFLSLLFAILAVNALGGSISALYNLYLLDNPLFGLTFSQSLFLIEIINIVGMVLSSLTPNDYFAKQSIETIIIWIAFSMIGLGLSNFLHLSALISLTLIAFMIYLLYKVNPKIQSMLLSSVPSNVLAQTSSFLSFLFSFSIPAGTMLFTSLALWNMDIAWASFSIISLIALYLSYRMKK